MVSSLLFAYKRPCYGPQLNGMYKDELKLWKYGYSKNYQDFTESYAIFSRLTMTTRGFIDWGNQLKSIYMIIIAE